jgi:hypothetical protein
VLLFGLCGAGSSLFYYGGQSWHNDLVAIPFGIACGLLVLRSRKAVFIIPLYVLVWLVALNIATRMAMFLDPHGMIVSMCTGGLIGGGGVCLASGIVKRGLLSPRCILGACVVGCVVTIPFGLIPVEWHAGTRQPWPELAIWQGGVGTYLYAACTGSGRNSASEDLASSS